MPPKKKGDKKKKGKKRKMIGHATPEELVRKFHRIYERNCAAHGSAVCMNLHHAMKNCIEDENLLTRFVITPNPVISPNDAVVSLEPVITAIRQDRYAFLKDLHIWELPLMHEQIASLALLIEKGINPFRSIELLDCLVEPYALRRLSLSFYCCETLTQICFDHNEFGDEGCKGLCEGLMGNRSILSLSLNYCGLKIDSGHMLGDIIATTAIRDLYVDGNDLECDGAMELVRLCADHASIEAFNREEEAQRLREAVEEAARLAEEERYKAFGSSGDESRPADSRTGSAKPKKKKKGKKKSKEPPGPPPVGPWLHKLHIADNGIDACGSQGSCAPLTCMRLFKKLITNSECLQELDLEDNLIGNLAGRELVEALQMRSEAGLPGMKIRTTHRLAEDTFDELLKLGAGLKKKKGKKGKKKKK